jgi:rRNA-processing protein CGR1
LIRRNHRYSAQSISVGSNESIRRRAQTSGFPPSFQPRARCHKHQSIGRQSYLDFLFFFLFFPIAATTLSSKNELINTTYSFCSDPTQIQKQIMSTTSNTRQSAIFVEDAHNLVGDIVKMSKEVPTKGRNVSGRSWKVRPQKRSSSLVKTKINNQSKPWEVREQERLANKEIRELQTSMREDRRQGKIVKKERRLENVKRRAENEFKSSQMSAKNLNTSKLGNTLKAMSKKQLRQVKKTRVNPKTGLVEYVSAYSK